MFRSESLMTRWAVALAAVAALIVVSASVSAAEDVRGAVYVLSNQTSNSVLVYARAANGSVAFSGSFSTGGAGMGTGGDPLGSQGSLVLGRWHRLLFAVNAGSNDVSVFAVEGRGLHLRLLDRVSSGGTMPVSIAIHGRLVYVLNAGGTPNIQGFFLDPFGGYLVHLPGSARPLPGGASSAAAEVVFSPDGEVLMVTEKGTNQIDTWTIDDDGYANNVKTANSSGTTPFGFAFLHNFAVVSEAGSGAFSSYEVEENEPAELITGSLSDTQAAVCWVVIARNGRYRYAFGTNTGSGTISSYSIARDGSLSLVHVVAGTTGAGTAPIDMTLSGNSRFLYVREATKGMVDGFRVEPNGTLTPITSAGGVPPEAQGIAAF
jgi:6-phosphogluconolactonase (cycloisomerase 2 family)